MPWAAPFSVQAQLKRLADLLIAALLLLLTAPFVCLAAILIWLEDHGPVFYRQQRSGWLGRPFTVLKLRTMRHQSKSEQTPWTQPGDQRITTVGLWLRRLRLDELPQLLNVLNGEMSLIGPRPEQPKLEHDLERHIPHYRKRHWMRPGLSGWAQVCAPYASSIEDSDFKLSYDLYYLRHFSIWLDLVILFRTIKTVLKAGGRWFFLSYYLLIPKSINIQIKTFPALFLLIFFGFDIVIFINLCFVFCLPRFFYGESHVIYFVSIAPRLFVLFLSGCCSACCSCFLPKSSFFICLSIQIRASHDLPSLITLLWKSVKPPLSILMDEFYSLLLVPQRFGC